MIALPVHNPLLPGTRIGPYEVQATLGSGGMGEVYRARDGRLGRAVALKLLPAGVATDETALLRFEQEARAASALSHPNVVTVFDVGQEDGRPWLAMELVEGSSLRQLLARGAPPVRQALDLACQLADGLAAAHARGIVHRDLKPENLMVGDDGHLKILDFGIAKLADPGGSTGEPATTVFGQHGVLPVRPEPHTRPGTILGTVGYLSPEQARGQAADARSDQFAFGAILYELLSGERAFGRETTVDTLSAILREDPPPLPPERAARVPAPVLWVVQRCLAKEPRERYASTLDLARDLRQLRDNLASLSTLSSGAPAAVEPVGRPQLPKRSPLLVGGALAALAAAFTGGVLLGPRIAGRAAFSTTAASGVATAVPTLRYVSYSGRDGAPALSRDGRLLAFVSRRSGPPRIWVQVAGGREAALTEGPDEAPRISPDGTSILFVRDEGARRSLYRVPVVGGPPRKAIDDAVEGDWAPDGRRIVFVRIAAEGGRTTSLLGTAAADGSEPRELARVDDRVLRTPRWSPDGSRVAARLGPLQGQLDPELVLFDATSGARRELAVSQRQGQLYGFSWRSPEELLYAEVSGATAAGSSRLLALDVGSGRARTLFTLPGRIAVVDAAGPRIAADVLSNRQVLRELPISGDRASPPGRPLTQAGAEDRQPAYSPDGRWLVFSSNRTGNLDLWLLDTQTGEERQLTDDEADDWDPAFTPDGRSLLWSTNRGGHFEIWQMAVDGSGARQLTSDGADAENPTTTPDGRWVVYNSFNPKKSGVWKVRADGSGAERLVAGATTLPEVSPDGRHVLFVTDYVGRKSGTLRAVRVADGAAVFATTFPYAQLNDGRPRWLPRGGAFTFVARDEAGVAGIFLQPFAIGRDTSAQRRPFAGFDPEAPAESFGLSPDGTRLALSTAESRSYLLLAQAEGDDGDASSDGRGGERR